MPPARPYADYVGIPGATGMQPRNHELYCACRDYVELALNKVREEMPSTSDLLRELDKPIAHPMLARHHGRFVSRILRQIIGSLNDTPQRQRVTAAVLADQILNGLVDRMVGTPGMQHRISLDAIANAVVFMYPASLPDCSFEQPLFDKAYEDFERTYYATEIEINVVMPFYAMRAPGAPIDFTSDVKLRKLEENECPWFILDEHMIGPVYGLAAKLRFPIPIPTEVWDRRENQADPIQAQMSKICKALAVFKRGKCAIVGTITTSESPLLASTSLAYPEHAVRTPFFDSYEILPVEVDELRDFYVAMVSRTVVQNKAVQVAIRRFFDLVHRTNTHDRLVDLVIAAEAIFLSDQQHQSELRYRLALRAAAFLSNWNESPRAVFKQFKKAYDMRSKIVHGGNLAKFEKEANLAEFTKEFEDAVRFALKRVIVELAEGGNPLQDWDPLIERRLTHQGPNN